MASPLGKKHRSGQSKYPQRNNNIEGLWKVFRALRHYQYANLDNEILNKLQIEVSSSFEDDDSRFFTPFDQDEFETLWTQAELLAKSDPEYDRQWPTFWLSTNYAHAYHLSDLFSNFCARFLTNEGEMIADHGSWTHRTTDNSRYENSLGCAPGGEHNCVISCVLENTDPKRPHLGCEITDGAEMDDRLLWSEALSAVSLMANKLFKNKYRKHRLAPMFIITIAGKKARVLQAHFDGHLVIQKSPIIDLSKENIDGMKYLQRWSLCQPKGNTLCDPPVKGSK